MKPRYVPQVGDKAVVLTDGGGWHDNRSVKEVTVVKVGKQRVTLDTGDWFNMPHLTKRRGSDYGPVDHLLSADDPRVTSARQAMAVRTWRNKVRATVDELARLVRTAATVTPEALVLATRPHRAMLTRLMAEAPTEEL